MIRRTLLTLALCLTGAAPALAQSNVSLSLNLAFNNPSNLTSGGTWKIVGKANARGIAGLDLRLANLNFSSPAGFLGPAGFEERQTQTPPGHREIVFGDNASITPLTLDVGVIGGPVPSSYVDAPNLVILPGNPNLGSFTGGVELLGGTFNAGATPGWFSAPGSVSAANGYVSDTFPGGVVAANLQLTVRYLIPEPGSCSLTVAGALAMAARRRRRR
jgi:hypothetical protein